MIKVLNYCFQTYVMHYKANLPTGSGSGSESIMSVLVAEYDVLGHYGDALSRVRKASVLSAHTVDSAASEFHSGMERGK